jgi:hypothetical protein
MRETYAPPDHDVHKLVHPTIAAALQHLFESAGSPTVDGNTIWTIYALLLAGLNTDQSFDRSLASVFADDDEPPVSSAQFQPRTTDTNIQYSAQSGGQKYPIDLFEEASDEADGGEEFVPMFSDAEDN